MFTGDKLKPNCVEEVEKIVDNYPELGAVYWPYEFKKGNKKSITRSFDKSRYISSETVNERHFLCGGSIGAISSNLYVKKAIVESGARFNEIFIGKSDFDFRVLQKHGVFYLNKVLSTFDVEHHGTFKYALNNYRINLEVSLNSACAIERSRDILTEKKYCKYRSELILITLQDNIHFLKVKDLVKLFFIWISVPYLHLVLLAKRMKYYVEARFRKI